MNREAFGAVTDSFLRMGLTDASGNVTYYHPTFLYESLWNALGLLLLHFYSKRRKFDGQIFIMYLGWYGLGRVFIEGLRMDSLYVGSSNLRVSQLVAGLCFLCAAIFLIYDKIFREHDPDDLYVNRAARLEKAVTTTEETTEKTPEETPEKARNEENPEMGNDSEENEELATEAPEASDEE
jgi:phosphatidylglycerol:prolipoprotein diacylglycerol transferase